MNVHITLVGGQPAPVYNGIVATQPDKVVFIYSEGTREAANRISDELKNIPSERRRLDPVDLNDIELKVLQCAEQFKGDTVTVNISGGTKPWAFYFAKVFGQMPNATLFYTDQNNMLWNLSNKTSNKIVFDMATHFRLHGNPLDKFTDYRTLDADDSRVLKQIDELMAFNGTSLFRLIAAMNDRPGQSEAVLKNGSSLVWNKAEKLFAVALKQGSETLSKTLKSKNVRPLLLKAGWFECRIARILSIWDKAKEVWWNCRFPYKDAATKNEIDVIVNASGKPLFVECKTQINDVTDIDKFASAVKNYGGLGSKALFVTYSKMNSHASEKCADNGILTFSMSDTHSV